MNYLYLLDLIGTGVFAISGALTAAEKKLDVFGIAAVAFITAVGGGTLRDVLIGSTPVSWMNDLTYLILIVVGFVIAISFKSYILNLRKTFFLFDTIGIGVFTVLGLEKSLEIGLHPVISVMMGMVSAVFGGVIRDIVCNEIPLIFRKEIYALACIIGGAVYFLLGLLSISHDWVMILTVLSIISIRIVAVKYKLSLTIF